MSNLSSIRKEYTTASLSEKDTADNPIVQFDCWWQEAINSQIDEVNAMTLSTVDQHHRPSSRIVLLKGYDSKGFVFFTNYKSHKATDMESNSNVALVFFWKELERQIRIEGSVQKISDAESDDYFLSRPISSQIGAWASPQSTVIASRDLLDKNSADIEARFAHQSMMRPPFWGGYIVKPTMIEFWQGRPSRLHDRIEYKLNGEGVWIRNRLAP